MRAPQIIAAWVRLVLSAKHDLLRMIDPHFYEMENSFANIGKDVGSPELSPSLETLPSSWAYTSGVAMGMSPI